MTMRKGKAFVKRILCIFLLAVTFIVNCGLAFNTPVVDMDPDENPSYEYIDLSELSVAAGSDRAADKYRNKYYWSYGIVRALNLGGKTVSISSPEDESAKVDFKNDGRNSGGLSVNDEVRLFFRINKNMLGKVSLDIDRIERSGIKTVTGTVYSTANGRTLRISEENKRVISDGKVSFNIPDGWKNVEVDIRENELGSIEGYQYKLNKLGKGEAYSECLFVTYFDKTKMVDVNDRNDNKGIEKAIVKDILKKDVSGKFPLREITSAYGPKYKYYRSNFKRSTGETYLTEFVFQEHGDGIVVVLYLYRDKKHLDDIMNVLRTIR